MYARTNRCYNKRGSGTNYIRSSAPHCSRKHADSESSYRILQLQFTFLLEINISKYTPILVFIIWHYEQQLIRHLPHARLNFPDMLHAESHINVCQSTFAFYFSLYKPFSTVLIHYHGNNAYCAQYLSLTAMDKCV
jgi:hypothetical protein